jgi:hypothetical protein
MLSIGAHDQLLQFNTRGEQRLYEIAALRVQLRRSKVEMAHACAHPLFAPRGWSGSTNVCRADCKAAQWTAIRRKPPTPLQSICTVPLENAFRRRGRRLQSR